MKRTLALLLSIVMVFGLLPLAAMAEEEASAETMEPIQVAAEAVAYNADAAIAVGASKTVTLKSGETASYVFTAENDGVIVAYTPFGNETYDQYNDCYYYPCLSTEISAMDGSSHSVEVTSDRYEGAKISVTAGKRYAVNVSNYNNFTMTSEVFVAVPDMLEGMTLNRTRASGNVGDYLYLAALSEPETAFASVTWTSSDPSVAEIEPSGADSCMVYLKAVGTAEITAKASNGMQESCVITVREMETIGLGQSKTLTLDAGDSMTYEFTAQKDGTVVAYMPDGEYRYSEELGYGYMSAFDLYIYSGDYRKWSENASVNGYTAAVIDVTAGQTYLLQAQNYTPDTVTGTFCFEEAKPMKGLGVSEQKLTCYVGDFVYVEAVTNPMPSFDSFRWTVADPGIVSSVSGDGYCFNGTALKPGRTTLTVTAGSGLTATCTVTVKEAATISCDKPETVSLSAQDVMQYNFTCKESGDYVFYTPDQLFLYISDNSGNNYYNVLNSEYRIAACYMEAGKTYSLVVRNYYSTTVSGSVTLSKAGEPTAIDLPYDGAVYYVGEYIDLYVDTDPALAVNGFSWSSGNPSVAALDDATANQGGFRAIAPGAATITVRHRNGLTDSCEITVIPVPEIRLGESRTETLAYGEYVKYSFTPESTDTYQIATPVGETVTDNSGEEVTGTFYAYFLSSDLWWLEQEEWVKDGISYVSAELTAGETYTICIYNTVDMEGTLTAAVTLSRYAASHEHAYAPTGRTEPVCTDKGSVIHTCSVCGESYTEELAALGHDFVEWATVTEATCTAAGEARRGCSRCGESETKSIPKAGHVFADGVCTGCGIGEEEAKFLLGDANGDGVVNNVDAMLVLQFAVGLNDASALNTDACDVNADGFINNVDAMRILQFAVGLIDSFGAKR